MSFVDVVELIHRVLRASVGVIGSSRKQAVCVQARAQDDWEDNMQRMRECFERS